MKYDKKLFPLSKVYQLLEPGPVVMVTTIDNGKPNIMTITWHMMVDFEPPIIACVISNRNFSFKALEATKECVINIPAVELAQQVVGVGNTTGSKVGKFEKFHFTQEPASIVKPPLIGECYANIECKVIDRSLADKYNIFILEGVKAWITTSRKRPRTFHHWGNGVFTADGKMFKLASNKK